MVSEYNLNLGSLFPAFPEIELMHLAFKRFGCVKVLQHIIYTNPLVHANKNKNEMFYYV